MRELAQDRAVSVSELSRRYRVSEVSIRRDLARLQSRGQLRRIHGGALAGTDAPNAAADAASEPGMLAAKKQRIGQAAAALVQPGERLFLDSGTTVLEVARHLPHTLRETGNLTAITNSLPIVIELGSEGGMHLIILGGVYLPRHAAVVGPSAVQQLSTLHVDKIFLGADGLSFSHGLTNANVLEAEVDRAAIGAATQIIAVADSSKIGRIGLTRLLPLEGIHKLVTDTGAPAGFVEQLRALGVEVVLV